MKVVIIGGVAAGTKAAAVLRRQNAECEIHIYTDDTHVSYSSCGLPYFIEGNFDDIDYLIARTPEQFAESNIQVHLLYSRVAAGALNLRRGPQGPALLASGKASPHASCSGASPDSSPIDAGA